MCVREIPDIYFIFTSCKVMYLMNIIVNKIYLNDMLLFISY